MLTCDPVAAPPYELNALSRLALRRMFLSFRHPRFREEYETWLARRKEDPE
ncbi:MAG: hypothetical protein LBJ11_06420 [Oscillospiraceae bacterium]|jgi:hypothetical protein|nr:hypothetical protein [Oscillospiraceae bacterium]